MIKTFLIALHLTLLGAKAKKLEIKLLLMLSLGIFYGILSFALPLFLSLLVKAVSTNDKPQVLLYFIAFVACSFMFFLGKYICRFWLENISTLIPISLKQIYFEKLFHKPYSWHLNNSVGYFSTALERVCNGIHTWLWKGPFDYVPQFVFFFCFLGYSLYISPFLFFYFIITISVAVFIMRLLYQKRLHYLSAMAKSQLAFGKRFIDFLYNIRSIKKMNLFDFANKHVKQKGDDVCDKAIQMMRYNSHQWGLMDFFSLTVFFVPITYYIFQYFQNGSGVEVIVMLISVQPKMEQVGRQLMSLMHDVAIMQTECEILSCHLGTEETTKHPSKNKNIWHKICFQNTLFVFEKEGHIFQHQVADFTINRGDHIAIIGKSGEGKTTFLNLLINQFPLHTGNIYVDGKKYEELSQSFFDTHITYISQDVELFDMTLYDNIVMGKDVPQNQLKKIIDGCCLNELIERMHGNIHTDIGEKGIKVSAGEKQRINLARGLLLNRDILVLDEITANLDPYTTQNIWHFIFSEYADKTIVAVSHEEGLLKHVKRRFEFKKGIGCEA